MFLDDGKDWIERQLHHPSSSCNSWVTYFSNQKEQGIPRALVVTVRGLKFTPNDPSIPLGMDVDFAATKSHIMSKETPKMKKAFMKLCTDVEGSFISLSFKISKNMICAMMLLPMLLQSRSHQIHLASNNFRPTTYQFCPGVGLLMHFD